MRNSKIMTAILMLSIFMQLMSMKNTPIFDYELPFLSGLLSADSMSGNLLLTLYSVIPFPFVLMCFSGEMKNLTERYGKLLIIRSCSKKRLIRKLMIKTATTVAGITLFMWGIFTYFKEAQWMHLGVMTQGKAVTMYGLTMLAIVLMQYILELYLEVQHSNIGAIIGMAATVFISGALGDKYRYVNFILFPNLAFAQKNGIIAKGIEDVSFESCFYWIVLICIGMYCFILKKIVKIDIM